MTIDLRILEHLTEPTFATDAFGKITLWNQAMATLTGREASAVMGKKSWAGFYPKRRATPIDEALSTSESLDAEITFTEPDSDIDLTVQLNVTVVPGDDGEPACVLGRVAASGGAQVERDEAARIRSAIEGSGTAMMMVDRDLVITYVNPASIRLFRDNLSTFASAFPGFNADRLVGTCIDVFHKNPAHQRQLLGNAANLPHRATIQVGPLSITLNISAMRDGKGEHIGATLEWANVTEQRAKAEAAARLSSQIEGSGVGVMVCDLNRVITYCNPAVIAMLQKYESELRKALPALDTRRLIGMSIDEFHRNPRHQAALLVDHRTHPLKTEIKVAGLEFGLNLTTLYDENDKPIGNAVEWSDLNERAAYTREVLRVLAAAQEGDLKVRGSIDILAEGYRPSMMGINDIVDAIVAPLREAQDLLAAMAQNDLSIRVTGDYRGDHALIKANLNAAADSLDSTLTSVVAAIRQVQSASEQISAGAQTLARGTNEQASKLEEISSTLEEITAMTQQNAANASQARGLAQTSRNSADAGNIAMDRLAGSIDRIKTSSDKTAKIIKTIDEIAFQTNLLALNAAVEAARAGDAGKGFAVVAEEVRNLAQRSAEAAKNTAEMLEGAVKNADEGVKLGEEVSRQLKDIVTGATKVTEIVAEIAAASDEQAKGVKQINVAVAQVNNVTQQNAANSEESASAAEELNAQSGELAGMLNVFTLTDEAGDGRSGGSRQVRGGSARGGHAAGRGARALPGRRVHEAGGRPALRGQGHVSPEQIIPLSDDELEGF